MNNYNGQQTREIERFSVFELSGKLFGLEILNSREVIPLPKFTPLPNSHRIFCGVFNLRGDIYPLMDISPVLGLPAKRILSTDMVVLLDNNTEYIVGMVVDKIHSIVSYAPAELKSPKGIASPSLGIYISGVIQSKENTIYVLDLQSLFKAKEIRAHT